MTSPYYTTVPKVQTLGPADDKAPMAAKFYTTATALFGLVAVALAFGWITPDQATALDNLRDSGLLFAAAVPAAVAAFRTRKQLKNGTFEKAPADPVGDVFSQINVLQSTVAASTDLMKQTVDDAVAHAQTQVKQGTDAITGAISLIPGGAVLSAAIRSGPAGDLVQAMDDLNGALH